MGSSYFGEPSLGSGRSGSSRKGKKSNSDKPKQPQRGLGVAQLERIISNNQMGSSYPSLHILDQTSNLNQGQDVGVERTYSSVPVSPSFSYSSSQSFGFHPNIKMGMEEMETTDFRLGDSSSSTTARWNHSMSILETQYGMQPSVTPHLLSLHEEDLVQKRRREDWCDSMGSSIQKSDLSDTQEIDLELKLSL